MYDHMKVEGRYVIYCMKALRSVHTGASSMKGTMIMKRLLVLGIVAIVVFRFRVGAELEDAGDSQVLEGGEGDQVSGLSDLHLLQSRSESRRSE